MNEASSDACPVVTKASGAASSACADKPETKIESAIDAKMICLHSTSALLVLVNIKRLVTRIDGFKTVDYSDAECCLATLGMSAVIINSFVPVAVIFV
jgi:hypothetical protein